MVGPDPELLLTSQSGKRLEAEPRPEAAEIGAWCVGVGRRQNEENRNPITFTEIRSSRLMTAMTY